MSNDTEKDKKEPSKDTIKYQFQKTVEVVQDIGTNLGTVTGKQEQGQFSNEALSAMSQIFKSLSDITQILEKLQKENPQATEAQAQEIIEAEFTKLNKSQLELLRKQLLNKERWFNGGKAALVEIAKHYVENNPIYKAFLAFIERFVEGTWDK